MNLQSRPFPKLHIFLGAGGVGKTTLSAAYATSLAAQGRNVGLLSVDPAKRLQSALGLSSLPEMGQRIDVPQGRLEAALLHPSDSLRRWVKESVRDARAAERLFHNPFYIALADKLATATDTFAAIRMAEWVEQNTELDDLVIDTAPGIHAIDFLSKPEKLMAFFDSKLIEWLKWLVEGGEGKRGFIQKVMKTSARKVLDGLATIGGKNMLLNFAEFIVLLDDVILQMVRRLNYARAWLRSPTTDLLLVTAVRNDAASVANALANSLREIGLVTNTAIINRSQDRFVFDAENLEKFKSTKIEPAQNDEALSVLRNYVTGLLATQERMRNELSTFARQVVELPIMPHLDKSDALRIADLLSLGDTLRITRERGR